MASQAIIAQKSLSHRLISVAQAQHAPGSLFCMRILIFQVKPILFN